MTPSKLAQVPFVSVHNMLRLVNDIGPMAFITDLAAEIEADFRRWPEFDKTARLASHSRDGVIELMPTADADSYGFKYVNGHPSNLRSGHQTVTAFGVLSSVANRISGAADRDDPADRAAHGGHVGAGRALSCAQGGRGHGDDRQWRAMRISGAGLSRAVRYLAAAPL